MRTIAIGGKDYPLALTLGAMEVMDGVCGGFENAGKMFDGKRAAELVSMVVKILHILMEGGRDYVAAQGGKPSEVPDEHSLRHLFLVKDMAEVKTTIFAAMAESMVRTVDVEPDPKNAKATQSG